MRKSDSFLIQGALWYIIAELEKAPSMASFFLVVGTVALIAGMVATFTEK